MSDKAGAVAAPVVWIFGGGITGLSVAHECIERGYDVFLVEPSEDTWENHLPAVGGVAKTQWAYIPNGTAGPGASDDLPPEQLVRALPFVRHPTFEFSEPEVEDIARSVAGTWPDEYAPEAVAATLAWKEITTELDGFIARLIAATRGAGYQTLTVALSAPVVRATGGAEGVSTAEEDARTTGGRHGRHSLPPPNPSDSATNAAVNVRLAMAAYLQRVLEFASVEPDILRVEGMRGFRLEVRVQGRGIVPGEHGFRYFPGFYRHLFDTMRRTPVLQRGDDRFGQTMHTVFDNLVSTEATWLVVTKDRVDDKGNTVLRADGKPETYERLVNFPRRPPQSIQQLITVLESFVRELNYSAQDVSRLTTKLFQYMTSSTERREGEFEDLTWWDFIEGERFSDLCRKQMELGPEVLGAMTASESEARTQGNCVTQLLIDQLSGRALTDATLNGPTSVAWFDPWRDYLVYRGVKFLRGKLVDFVAPDRSGVLHKPGVLLPRVLLDGHAMSLNNFDTALRPHYFVMAVPLAAMLDAPEFNLTQNELGWGMHGEVDVPEDRLQPAAPETGYGLARKFRAAFDVATRDLPDDPDRERLKTVEDFDAVLAWQERLRNPTTPREVGLGPLRHLTGVQYLFENNIQFGQEHTLYMDAPWRLSSISQAHFWRRRPTGLHGYRGIVSVDIGSLHRPAAVRGPDGRKDAQQAWDCAPDTIANAVWDQVKRSVAVDTQHARRSSRETPLDPPLVQPPAYQQRPAPRGRTTTPPPKPVAPQVGIDVDAGDDSNLRPSCYHLDENLIFRRVNREPVSVAKNLAPYLINRPGEWKLRPGRLNPPDARHDGYLVQNESWLLAGTYLKTFTRLTTMEAANESARHAVNALLRDAQAPGDRCMIWDPEEWELPDFALLREIDRRLYVDGYPHMVEILGLDAIPEALIPRQLDLQEDPDD